jgi:hypothetical protein
MTQTTGPARNIYLAGKITKNGWRQQFVDPSYSEIERTDKSSFPYAKKDLRPNSMPLDEWIDRPHQQPMRDGVLNYVGPWFISCDHGCSHSGEDSHATVGGCIEGDIVAARMAAANSCLAAIERCDALVALVSDDAHGTLVEIGFALGIRRQVFVTDVIKCCGGKELLFAQRNDALEAWFALYATGFRIEATVVCCVTHVLDWLGFHRKRVDIENARAEESQRCESPPEKALLAAMRKHRELDAFHPQVAVQGGRYRLDFGDTQRRIAVEVDGLRYHNGQESFARDRRRERDLVLDGWQVVRFAAIEVNNNADACAQQLVTIVSTGNLKLAQSATDIHLTRATVIDPTTGRAALGNRAHPATSAVSDS